MFYYIYSRFANEPLYKEFGDDLLDDISKQRLNNDQISFENGLCGIGWGIEFLIRNNFITGNTNVILEDFDKVICSIKPIVRVQENINSIRNNSDVSELLASIKELTIHLSGVKLLSDSLKYHQQIIYPQQADITIKFEVVKEFILNNNIPSDIKLNIVLGKDFEEKNKIISF